MPLDSVSFSIYSSNQRNVNRSHKVLIEIQTDARRDYTLCTKERVQTNSDQYYMQTKLSYFHLVEKNTPKCYQGTLFVWSLWAGTLIYHQTFIEMPLGEGFFDILIILVFFRMKSWKIKQLLPKILNCPFEMANSTKVTHSRSINK